MSQHIISYIYDSGPGGIDGLLSCLVMPTKFLKELNDFNDQLNEVKEAISTDATNISKVSGLLSEGYKVRGAGYYGNDKITTIVLDIGEINKTIKTCQDTIEEKRKMIMSNEGENLAGNILTLQTKISSWNKAAKKHNNELDWSETWIYKKYIYDYENNSYIQNAIKEINRALGV